MLSKEQLALCSVFRAKDGSLRKAEFDALLNSGALPMNEFRMSRADIVDLLGGSPGGEQEDLKYDLGWEGQSRYNCTFRFRNRFAAGLYQERDF